MEMVRLHPHCLWQGRPVRYRSDRRRVWCNPQQNLCLVSVRKVLNGMAPVSARRLVSVSPMSKARWMRSLSVSSDWLNIYNRLPYPCFPYHSWSTLYLHR
jgi:hypothetical protein